MPAKSVRKRSFVKAGKPQEAGLLLGYARVSKGDEQNNALQTKALKAAGCRRLFEEAASGGRWDRPELHRMLDHLREGDTVVVWKLDRLSRSLKDVLHIMERIAKAGAGFRSITENIDTTTPAGRMMMQMVGAFAEFERAMIRERTSAGLAAARAEGRIGGRRKKLDRWQAQRDRRKRHLRPKVRRRDGAPLQYQRAHRVTDRRPAPNDEENCRMTRTYEIKPRGSNLGFDLKLYEDGVEMGGGIFPAHERITEAEAFDDAMAEAEAWVGFGRDYRTQSERERSGN